MQLVNFALIFDTEALSTPLSDGLLSLRKAELRDADKGVLILLHHSNTE